MQGNTVIARRDKHGFYHKKCANVAETQPVTPDDETEIYDPEIVRRACIECGQWILNDKQIDAYWEIMEQKQSQVS